MEREFPRGAAEVSGPEADESTRRNFLKYMGASASLAGLGLAGCRRPDQFIIPFNKHVEDQIPGRPLYYSSARPVADGCVPLVVTTFEGRPTKVEGNRLHPEWKGGSDVFTQASILDLYDPDRSAVFRKEGEVLDGDRFVEEFEKGFLAPFRAAKGAKSALLGRPLVVRCGPCLQTLTRILTHARPNGPMLLSAHYKPWPKDGIVLRFRRLREAVGLDGVTAYSYRHTYATDALQAGISLPTVAALLGHVNPTMVSRVYGHLEKRSDHLSDAVAKIKRAE